MSAAHLLLAQQGMKWPLIAGIAIGVLFVLVMLAVAVTYGKLWFQAYMSNARVSIFSLIGMSLRQVDASLIVRCKIMALQAGVGTDPRTGITTRRLEGHYLAGGNVPSVIKAIIAGHRADIDLDFERAAAIDLAGRDVLDAACRQKVDIRRISFIDALRWLQSSQLGDDLCKLAINSNRLEPRVIKRRPMQYDLMNKPRRQLKKELNGK